MMNRMNRTALALVAVLALAVGGGALSACDGASTAPKADNTDKAEPGKGEKPSGDGATADKAEAEPDYKAEAKKEITEDNAEKIAADLEKELGDELSELE